MTDAFDLAGQSRTSSLQLLSDGQTVVLTIVAYDETSANAIYEILAGALLRGEAIQFGQPPVIEGVPE